MKDLEFLFSTTVLDIEVENDENNKLTEFIIGDQGYKIYSHPETNIYILVSHNGFIAMYSDYLKDVFEYLKEELNHYFINQEKAELLSKSNNTKIFRLWSNSNDDKHYIDMTYHISNKVPVFLKRWFNNIKLSDSI